jgi:Sigma-70 region 2
MDAKSEHGERTAAPRGRNQADGGAGLGECRARTGHNAEALGEIYRRYVRRVFGLCRYMLDSRESAEDATSEVFLKLQRSAPVSAQPSASSLPANRESCGAQLRLGSLFGGTDGQQHRHLAAILSVFPMKPGQISLLELNGD